MDGNVEIGMAPVAGLCSLQLASATTTADGIDPGNDTFLVREAAAAWLAPLMAIAWQMRPAMAWRRSERPRAPLRHMR